MAKSIGGFMREGTKRRRQNKGIAVSSGLALFLMICLFVLSGCGSSQSGQTDHPLTLNTPTGDQGGTATADTGSGIPVVVVADQSTLSAYPGGFMTMTVSTTPYAVCNFLIYYGLSTPSKTYGIVPRTADANGIASWHWQVDSSAHTGSWPLSIAATVPSGKQSTAKIDVSVTLPPISVVASQTNLNGAPKSQLTLAIQTAPGLDCTLLLSFGPGSNSKTLKARSGAQGLGSWNWNVPKDASPGVWPLTITVFLHDGESTSNQVNMTIQ